MIAKIVVLCAAVAAVNAGALLHGAGLINTGASSSSRQQDAFGNYAFNYGIADGIGATNSRAEVGDGHGNKKGTYTITDIDGRARRVDYVADGLGFRASIKTNEPGTALSAPAAALVASPYAGPVAPVDVAHVAAAPALLSASAINHVAAAAPYAVGVAPGLGYGVGLGYGAGHLGLGYGVGHLGLGYGAGHLGLGYGAGLLKGALL